MCSHQAVGLLGKVDKQAAGAFGPEAPEESQSPLCGWQEERLAYKPGVGGQGGIGERPAVSLWFSTFLTLQPFNIQFLMLW